MFSWILESVLARVKKHQAVGQLCSGATLAVVVLLFPLPSAWDARFQARLGFLRHLHGNTLRAMRDLEEALRVAVYSGSKAVEAEVVGMLGVVCQSGLGEKARAAKYYRRKIELLRELGQDPDVDPVTISLGTLLRELGEHDEAERCFRTVLSKSWDERLRINVMLELGRLFHDRGDLARAKQEILVAIDLTLPGGFPNEIGDCYRQLARIAKEWGCFDEAREHYEVALTCYQNHGYHAKVEAIREEMAKAGSGS